MSDGSIWKENIGSATGDRDLSGHAAPLCHASGDGRQKGEALEDIGCQMVAFGRRTLVSYIWDEWYLGKVSREKVMLKGQQCLLQTISQHFHLTYQYTVKQLIIEYILLSQTCPMPPRAASSKPNKLEIHYTCEQERKGHECNHCKAAVVQKQLYTYHTPYVN